MSTSNVVGSALMTSLRAGTALTALLSGTAAIYRGQAPDGATMPYVVFSLYAGGPLNDTPSNTRELVYFVRGYAAGAATAARVDEKISSLLHRGTLSVTGYTNYQVFRETDLETVEPLPNNERVYMAGALYRISLDA